MRTRKAKKPIEAKKASKLAKEAENEEIDVGVDAAQSEADLSNAGRGKQTLYTLKFLS